MTALVLAGLAVVLSGPVPALLSRLRAVRRAPRAALTLWQSVALAAVLSALGATLALSTDRVLDGRVSGADAVVAAVALGVTAVVGGRLLLVGHTVGLRLRRHRRRHREALDLVAADHPGPGQGPGQGPGLIPGQGSGQGRRGVVVLEDDTVAAYCLPALTRQRIVISRSVADRLPPDQLAAVVAHERAHLTARHDLVLEAFTVLHQAFPRFVSSSRALDEARLLVEVLADSAAARRHGALPLARALVALGDARAPAVALAAGAGPGSGSGDTLTTRVRLLSRRPHRALAAGLYLASAAVLALPTAFVVLPWLAALPR